MAEVIRFPSPEQLEEKRRREARRLIIRVIREHPAEALALMYRLDVVHPPRLRPSP